MAEVNLFLASLRPRTKIRRALQKADGKLAPDTVLVTLDAVISESYSLETEITSHPVERSVDVSDHIVLKPRVLTIKGRISATPFRLSNAISGVASSAGGQLAGNFGGSPLGAITAPLGAVAGGYAGKSLAGLVENQEDARLEAAVTELEAARDSRAPVIIESGLRLYPGKASETFYFLRSATIDRQQGIGRAIDVNLVFQEVVKASSRVVKVTFPKNATGAAKQNGGRQQAKTQTAEKTRGSATLLRRLKDNVAGLF